MLGHRADCIYARFPPQKQKRVVRFDDTAMDSMCRDGRWLVLFKLAVDAISRATVGSDPQKLSGSEDYVDHSGW